MATSYITNANLAQQVTDLINKWAKREAQMQAWIGGVVGGGDFADGKYPLTNVVGSTVYTLAPAALAASVTGYSTSAATYASNALASQTAAAASATAAAASATTATTQASNAAASAVTANMYSSNAATQAANALTYANNASTSATAAATSATNAATSAAAALASQTAAGTSATNAATSATAAAASAVLAATFTPSLYALLAGATFTGLVTLPNTASFTSLLASNIHLGIGIGFVSGQSEILTASTNPLGIGTAGAATLNLYTNSVQRLSITSAGTVGVNCTPVIGVAARFQDPGFNDVGLEIQRNTSSSVYLGSYNRAGSAYTNMTFYGSDYAWQTSGTTRVTIGASGNVVINAPATGASLIVNGDTADSTDGKLTITSAGAAASLLINSTHTVGTYTAYRQSGTSFGYIGSATRINGGLVTDFAVSAAGASGKLRLGTNGVDRIIIDGSGFISDAAGHGFARVNNAIAANAGLITAQSGGSASGGNDGDIILIY